MAVESVGASSQRVLVTGVTGLVGRHVAKTLIAGGAQVVGAVRGPVDPLKKIPGVQYCQVGDIGPATHWDAALHGVSAIVHAAAHAHVMAPRDADREAYRIVNVQGTQALAEAARRSGVARMLFVSSIKVNGEATPERAFRADDTPEPRDAFGRCKHEAELALRATLPAESWVIVRPPLVYGPGMRGNFARMTELVARGWPLPFAAIRNRRTLVGVDNLADLIAAALVHPRAAGRVWLAGDRDDVSTPELVRAIAAARGMTARLWSCPPALLRQMASVVGRGEEIRRLIDSLYLDSTPAREELGWAPRTPFAHGLQAALA